MTMARNCQEPNHLVLGYVGFDEETKGVRRFESIRKAFYLLRRAQHSYGYRTHMPNVAFRKSDFMREQGYQGNLMMEISSSKCLIALLAMIMRRMKRSKKAKPALPVNIQSCMMIPYAKVAMEAMRLR